MTAVLSPLITWGFVRRLDGTGNATNACNIYMFRAFVSHTVSALPPDGPRFVRRVRQMRVRIGQKPRALSDLCEFIANCE